VYAIRFLREVKKDPGVISHGYCKKCMKEYREANGLKKDPVKDPS